MFTLLYSVVKRSLLVHQISIQEAKVPSTVFLLPYPSPSTMLSLAVMIVPAAVPNLSTTISISYGFLTLNKFCLHHLSWSLSLFVHLDFVDKFSKVT